MFMVLLKLIAAVGAALLALVLYQWFRLQRLRRRASVTDLGSWVGTLLRSFAPGSVLIAEPNGKDGFLQFALTQRRGESCTLEFGLPQTDWSRAAIADVQSLLDSAGVSWTVETGVPGQPVQGFLRAELAGKREHVLQRARILLPRLAIALGHSAHQTYQVELLGHDAAGYPRGLADKLERLPKGGRLERKIAAAVRRTDRN